MRNRCIQNFCIAEKIINIMPLEIKVEKPCYWKAVIGKFQSPQVGKFKITQYIEWRNTLRKVDNDAAREIKIRIVCFKVPFKILLFYLTVKSKIGIGIIFIR